jgi:hypothetical protein
MRTSYRAARPSIGEDQCLAGSRIWAERKGLIKPTWQEAAPVVAVFSEASERKEHEMAGANQY